MKRISQINRKTNETNTILDIDLDGEGISNIQTNIGFFNHMIDLLAFHSNININLSDFSISFISPEIRQLKPILTKALYTLFKLPIP